MQELRRQLLKGTSAALLLSPWIGTGLLVPNQVRAAEWNRNAFTARTINEALKAFGSNNLPESKEIVISAPEIAENGAKVEVDITSNLPQTRSIALFADKNPTPLCAAIDFNGGALPYAKVQLKLAESTRVRAVVKSGDGKTYVAFREIKVTLGGCGG